MSKEYNPQSLALQVSREQKLTNDSKAILICQNKDFMGKFWTHLSDYADTGFVDTIHSQVEEARNELGSFKVLYDY